MTKLGGAKSIGLGIVGSGRIGTLRARLAAGHSAIKHIAVSDLDPKNAGKLADLVGGTSHGGDNLAVIDDPNVTAVIVSTSEGEHLKPMLAAIERGKAVLVEKPIALTVREADQVLAALKKHNGRMHVGTQTDHIFDLAIVCEIDLWWVITQNAVHGSMQLDWVKLRWGRRRNYKSTPIHIQLSVGNTKGIAGKNTARDYVSYRLMMQCMPWRMQYLQTTITQNKRRLIICCKQAFEWHWPDLSIHLRVVGLTIHLTSRLNQFRGLR